jgi:hypothetical protein
MLLCRTLQESRWDSSQIIPAIRSGRRSLTRPCASGWGCITFSGFIPIGGCPHQQKAMRARENVDSIFAKRSQKDAVFAVPQAYGDLIVTSAKRAFRLSSCVPSSHQRRDPSGSLLVFLCHTARINWRRIQKNSSTSEELSIAKFEEKKNSKEFFDCKPSAEPPGVSERLHEYLYGTQKTVQGSLRPRRKWPAVMPPSAMRRARSFAAVSLRSPVFAPLFTIPTASR